MKKEKKDLNYWNEENCEDFIIYTCDSTVQCRRCLKFTGNNPALVENGLCRYCHKEVWDRIHGGVKYRSI